MNPPPENAWEPWSPDKLFARLGRSNLDWYVVGGWALDLWHSHQTRLHEDLEFSVLSDRIGRYREKLSDLEFFSVKDRVLDYLPLGAPVPGDAWQLWGADMHAGSWCVDMMVDRGTPGLWVYKRAPSLTLSRAAAIRESASGIPYLAPALVLLFKAKHLREKDQHDFHAALPRLEIGEQADLLRWLETLHPGHEWIPTLRANRVNGQ